MDVARRLFPCLYTQVKRFYVLCRPLLLMHPVAMSLQTNVSKVVCVTPSNEVHVLCFTERALRRNMQLTYSPLKWTIPFKERVELSNIMGMQVPAYYDCSIETPAASIMMYIQKLVQAETKLQSNNLVNILSWFIKKFLSDGFISETGLRPFPCMPQAEAVLAIAPYIETGEPRSRSNMERLFVAFHVHKCLVTALPFIDAVNLPPLLHVMMWLQRLIYSFPDTGIASGNILYISSCMHPALRALLPQEWDNEWAAIVLHTQSFVAAARVFIKKPRDSWDCPISPRS